MFFLIVQYGTGSFRSLIRVTSFCRDNFDCAENLLCLLLHMKNIPFVSLTYPSMGDSINSSWALKQILSCRVVLQYLEYKKCWSDRGRHWSPQALELKFYWSCDYDSPLRDPAERREAERARTNTGGGIVFVGVWFVYTLVVWASVQCVCVFVFVCPSTPLLFN